MSDTTASGFFEDGPPGGRPHALNARDEIFRELRDANRAVKDDISRLWRQQARSLNRFSKALEDYSKHQTPGRLPSTGGSFFGNLFGHNSSALDDRRNNALVADIDKNSQEQTTTLSEIYQLMHDDSDRQKKRDLIQGQVAGKTLETLIELLKLMKAGGAGGGGGLLEDILAGRGLKNLFGFGRGKGAAVGKTAAALEEDVAKEVATRPGIFTRATRAIRNSPRAVSNLMERMRGIPKTATSVFEDLTASPRSAFSAIGRGASAVGRGALGLGQRAGSLLGRGATGLLSRAGSFLGKGLGAAGEFAGPLAAYGLYSSASDLTNERNTPFMGNQETGLMGSRMANYASAALSGAGVGAAGGAAFGGVGAIPGAIAGGLAGLGTAAYADFKPQIDHFASHIIDYVGNGMSTMWDALGGLTKDVFHKFPNWLMSKIPTFDELKAIFAADVSAIWGHLSKTILTTISDGEKWLSDQFSWNHIKSLVLGTPAAAASSGGLPGEPQPKAAPATPGFFSRVGSALGFNNNSAAPAAPVPEQPIRGGGGFFGRIGRAFGFGGSGTPTASSGAVSQPGVFSPEIGSEARGLLDTIAKGESGGDYSIMQGSKEHVTDFSQHPGRVGLGGVSTAAGRYQFIKGTWDEAAKALNLKDFSPQSQDKAAWWLAQRDYKRHTGGNLADDIKSKDPAKQAAIAQALNKTWTSLPGGGDATQQGGRKLNEYLANLEKNTERNQAISAAKSATPTNMAQGTSLTSPETGSGFVTAQNTATPSPITGIGSRTDHLMEMSAKTSNAATSISPTATNENTNAVSPNDINSGTTERSSIESSRPPPPPPMPETNAPAPQGPSTVVMGGGAQQDKQVDIDQIPMFITDNGMVFLNSNAAA